MAEKPPDVTDSAGGEELRGRYAQLMDRRAEGHLQEAEWERLACGEMSAAERARSLEHVTRCTLCADLYRGLVRLGEEARLFDPRAPRAAAPWPAWGRVPGWARWAAAAVIAVGVLTWVPRQPPVSSPMTRAPAAPSSLVPLEPSGTIATLPRQLRWKGMADAETYRVRLFREDGLLLWTSAALAENGVDWPVTLELAPAKYFWEVEAFREGKSLARSELLPFVWTP